MIISTNRVHSHFLSFCLSFFLSGISRFTGQQGKGKAISLIPLYHFQTLHRHWDISRAIPADSSPLNIASNWNWEWELGVTPLPPTPWLRTWRYTSATISGCYRILGLGKLRLVSLDSREIRTLSLFPRCIKTLSSLFTLVIYRNLRVVQSVYLDYFKKIE